MNPDYLEAVVSKYRTKGALVDTNLLLLYFVGRYDEEQIPRFKRTKVYTIDDFTLLAVFLARFQCLVTTPNILTEVSNLSGQLPEPAKTVYFQEFKRQVRILEENYWPSVQACESPYLERLGLTDSVIADISKDKYLVLTDDLRLSGFLEKLRIDVINFNHIRGWYLLSR